MKHRLKTGYVEKHVHYLIEFMWTGDAECNGFYCHGNRITFIQTSRARDSDTKNNKTAKEEMYVS